MEELENGLWNEHEKMVKICDSIGCLENAIRQPKVSEVKARLCLSAILLKHTPVSDEAQAQIKCIQLLLESTHVCFELKCRGYCLLSQYYQLTRATPSQSPKQFLYQGLELTKTSVDRFAGRLWSCNFNFQLANALMIEGDYQGSISVLEQGYSCAEKICYPKLQMFFASSVLHVHLMQRGKIRLVRKAFERCGNVRKSFETEKAQPCIGLMFYNDLLNVFYEMRTHNQESAAQNVKSLDSAMKSDMERTGQVLVLRKEFQVLYDGLSRDDLGYRDRHALKRKHREIEKRVDYAKQPSFDGHWLPERAVFALLELVAIIFIQPKGLVERPENSIQTGMQTIREEVAKLGFNDGAGEVDIDCITIWMASYYLTYVMHFLENKAALDLTQSDFVDAQLELLQMGHRQVLQACECTIKMLISQYDHSGCYPEAIDLNERVKRQKTRTSIVAVACNGDVFCGGDGLTTGIFAAPKKMSSMKTYKVHKDVYALGSGDRDALKRVTKRMRRVAKTQEFRHVGKVASQLAKFANEAKLFKDEDQINIILVGRKSIRKAARIYYVHCQDRKKERRYVWTPKSEQGLTFKVAGSGSAFMCLFKNRSDQKEILARLRRNRERGVAYRDEMMNYVKNVIGEARRWDYQTDGRLHIMAMCRGQKVIHRMADPVVRGNSFSGYGELERTLRRPLYDRRNVCFPRSLRMLQMLKRRGKGSRKNGQGR